MSKLIQSRLPGETAYDRRNRLRKHAEGIYATDKVEFADDAKVIDTGMGNGAWVQAWVWIGFEKVTHATKNTTT